MNVQSLRIKAIGLFMNNFSGNCPLTNTNNLSKDLFYLMVTTICQINGNHTLRLAFSRWDHSWQAAGGDGGGDRRTSPANDRFQTL